MPALRNPSRRHYVPTSVALVLLWIATSVLTVAAPASAARLAWPSQWVNPAGSASWEDWNYNQCGYAVINGASAAHLGADSQGYLSGPVRSIGSGVVKRVIPAAAPNNGLMIEYQSTAGPFTVLYQHVNPGVGLGASVAAGSQIGTVANWPNTGNNHVHVSVIPGAYTNSTSWFGYRNCATGDGGGRGHVNPIPWLAAAHPTGSTSSTNPRGAFDEVSSPGPGYITVRGWAFDADDTNAKLDIHVYIDGPAGTAGATGHATGPADLHRPDVGAAYPGAGDHHGFNKTVPVPSGGGHSVYVYAINVGGGENVLLGGKQVAVAEPDPLGNFELTVSPQTGEVRVAGWAFDPNSPKEPVEIHAYVGDSPGEGHNLGKATASRPDVATAFPSAGDRHGFDFRFPTKRHGNQTIHVYALNIGVGDHRLLGSRGLTIVAGTPKILSATRPSISGTPKVGKTLTASAGVWQQTAVKVSYQWFRGGKAIPRGTSRTYRLTKSDRKAIIRVRVTASKSGYTSGTVTTVGTKKVT